jgi:hypothetical protein
MKITKGGQQMDDSDAMIREINYILRRNCNALFLRKALTRLLTLERIWH